MGPEHRLQSRCRMYLADALPAPGYWSSVDHARKQSAQAGERQKARGIKRGLPDIMIWFRGLFIGVELKVGSRISDAQDVFAGAMRANGFRYAVIRSVTELDTYLRDVGVPVLPSMRIAAMQHDAALSAAAPAKPKRAGNPRRVPPRAATARDRRVAAIRNRPPGV